MGDVINKGYLVHLTHQVKDHTHLLASERRVAVMTVTMDKDMSWNSA